MPAFKQVAAPRLLASALCLACLFGWSAGVGAQVPLEKALSVARFPEPGDLRLELAPPLSLQQAISRGSFPAPSDLGLIVQPPLTLDRALLQARFPAVSDLTLRLDPPAGSGPAVRSQPRLGAETTANFAQLGAAGSPPPPPSAGSASPAMPDAAALAAIGAANLPVPQPLSVTLVPPATPLSAIAAAAFPSPQPLSVTLLPPSTPLAAIAAAKFPSPQPLSVTLYAGEALTAATMLAGLAPSLVLGSPYTVQIVQVIPRRGANFFDRNNPTGQTMPVAQSGGGAPAGGGAGGGAACVPPAGPPLGPEFCGSSFSLSDDGNIFNLNGGPVGNRNIHVTPVGGAQMQLAARPGITPTAACPNLLCTATQVFTPGAACNSVSYDDTGTPKTIVVRFRRNGAQVCGQLLDDPF